MQKQKPPEKKGISLEKKMELLTEAQVHCKSGYLILSGDKEVLDFSTNIHELLGRTEKTGRVSYLDYLSSMVSDDRQRIDSEVNEQLKKGIEFSTTYFNVKGPERNFLHILQHSRLFHDPESREICQFIVLQNVTELRRMERQLGYSESKFRYIFTSTPLGMLIYNMDAAGNLVLTDMNPAARQILKIKDDRLIGKTIEEAFPPLAQTEIPFQYKKVASEGNTWYGNNIEYDDGNLHNICDVTAFQTSLGTAAIIFQDITERKRVEDKLRESEEKYRKLVDNSVVGVFTVTLKGEILFVNDAVIRMLDCSSKDEVLHENFGHFYAIRNVGETFERIIRERRKISDFRLELITKSRRTITVSINAQIENKLISGVVTDISEKVRAEQKLIMLNIELQEINEKVRSINTELQKSEALKKALLNNLPHMAWMKDKNGVYLSVNEAFARSRGLSPEEVTGKTEHELYPADIAAKYRQEDQEVMGKRHEHFYYEKSGKLWFETYKAPIYDETDGIIGVSGVSLEITERKLAEEEIGAYSKKLAEQNEMLLEINNELIKAKEKAEESDKLKSSFLANMSHEIRTPMNAILGFANLLKNKNFSDERKVTFVEIINSKSKQLLQIITDIIDISKIEAGQISIFNKSFPINELIRELHLSFDNIRKQDNKPIVINYEIGLPDGEDFIFSDKIRIEQILSNFLSNALKFTENGTIELGYQIKNSSIVFHVRDTGIGLTPEEQKIIFDRFRQADASHSRSYSGTGLGLAISKGLAERMNGQIFVESDFSKGSVFYLKLPYVIGTSLAQAEKIFDESSFDWSDKTILIAEDEEDNYTFLEVLLKVTGANILWARNGIEAVEICRENSDINLVLMDIKMPHMDGLEATRQVKKIKSTLPVIVQTAYAMSADEESCLRAGCDAYIDKPIKIEPLFKLIKHFIG